MTYKLILLRPPANPGNYVWAAVSGAPGVISQGLVDSPRLPFLLPQGIDTSLVSLSCPTYPVEQFLSPEE